MHVMVGITLLLQNASSAGNPDTPGFLQHARDFSKFVSNHWSDIAKVMVALATLLSTGGVLGGRFSWLQRFIAPKRKADLIEQISKLAESMSKVQDLPEWAGELNAEVRATLKAEMEAKLSELKKLQSPPIWAHHGGSPVKSWLKYTFLWWKPKGFGAWAFHLSYYFLLAVIGLMSLGFLVGLMSHDPATGKLAHVDAADVTLAIILYAILGVPAMVLRFFAARIHRNQCDEQLRQDEMRQDERLPA
ncbi:hypothetical protein ACFPT7_19140 [Acidicapsa dinghuensis]|uniref:Uncharacterized protein n=1 Tax=Acidicapsa dinghuensis TaxID=2218256 RepID=A0ABW1EMB9_9BACT|nr:hypothetical protein [Acidicapsa dinghuensis]